MSRLLPLLVACALLSGCVHLETFDADSTQALDEINERSAEQSPIVRLHSGTEFETNSFRIEPDSVRWIDPESGQMRSMSLSAIESVRFTSSTNAGGILLAFSAIGVLGGALAGWTGDCTGWFGDELPRSECVRDGALIGGIPFMLIGLIVAAASSDATLYELESSAVRRDLD